MGELSTNEPLIAIVDDQRDVRTTLGRGLAAYGLRCHPFASGEDLLNAFDYLELDAILLDLRMPGLDGIQTLKAIPDNHRDIPVLFFTSHGDIPIAVEAMQQGAVDFIEKPSSLEQIAQKIKSALGSSKKAPDKPYTTKQANEVIAKLTKRQREILRLASRGLTSKEIADRIEISVRTVESHRHNAIQKIGEGRLANIVRLFQAAEE